MRWFNERREDTGRFVSLLSLAFGRVPPEDHEKQSFRDYIFDMLQAYQESSTSLQSPRLYDANWDLIACPSDAETM